MTKLYRYKRMPSWTRDTIPEALQGRHQIKDDTWAKLRVLHGVLMFCELAEDGEVLAEHQLTPETGVFTIEPQMWHKIRPETEDIEIQLAFYCQAKDYVAKKFALTSTHSAIIAASDVVPVGKALDLGCGQGRNALYLSLLGHAVTAVDYNPDSVEQLTRLAAKDNLAINTAVYNIHDAALSENYDFILSTVVFMFLNAERVPAIIADMQAHTNPGGYNLIVCAMNTEEYPCTMPFNFTFAAGELRNYYAGWEFIQYDESLGHLHARHSDGSPVQLMFVTMLARKPG